MDDRPRGGPQPHRPRRHAGSRPSSARASDRILVQVPGLQDPEGAEGAARPDRPARVQAGRPERRRRSRSPRAAPRSEARSCRCRGRRPDRRPAPGDGQRRPARRRPAGLRRERPAGRQHPFDGTGGQGASPGSPRRMSTSPSRSSSTTSSSRRRTSTSRSWAARPRSRQLHRRDRQRARHLAALGPAAGRAEGGRGAHRRSRSRRGFDPKRRHRQDRRHDRLILLFMSSPTAASASMPTSRWSSTCS